MTASQIMSLDTLLLCVDNGLRLLSPFMPFLTEELYQRLPHFKSEKRPLSICVASYPDQAVFKMFEDDILEKEVTSLNNLIRTIRSTRSTYDIPPRVKTEGELQTKQACLNVCLPKN